jgi:phospholipid/cholesterol/gamma-HCH transport system substrate-binding protein
MAQLRKTLDSYERMTPEMESTIKEIGGLAKAGREFIPELKRTNDNLRDIFSSSGEIGSELQKVIPDIRKTLDDTRHFLKTSEPRLAKALDEFAVTTQRIGEAFNPENQKAFTNILKSLDRLTLGADDLLKDSRTAMKSLNSTLAQAEQAMRPIAERLPKILENIDSGADQFNKTMIDVREIVKVVGRSDGTLMKIITDPTLYNNVNEAVTAMVRLTPRLDRILKDAEVFADKIARHPELLGFGGVVNPSSGLKEGPSAPMKKLPHGP